MAILSVNSFGALSRGRLAQPQKANKKIKALTMDLNLRSHVL